MAEYGLKSRGLSEKLEKSFQAVSDLQVIAQRKGVPIFEPFKGVQTQDGTFRIPGPSKEYYEKLIPQIQAPATVEKTAVPGNF